MTDVFPQFDRITFDPEVLGGVPVIRGSRISVRRVLELLAINPSWPELKVDYPALADEDIKQALSFAAAQLATEIIPLAS